VGPAVLHELEKFSVHSLGLPSLLSDPSAKTPEEALVHIFGEAKRTTPSILYLPQFHLWWDTVSRHSFKYSKFFAMTILTSVE
jgi:SpoVK/Ycf46/Vps4 family AAA+-type ATPase